MQIEKNTTFNFRALSLPGWAEGTPEWEAGLKI